LAVRPHSKRPHPAFRAETMCDVERRNVTTFITPYHCSISRIGNGVLPDRRMQLGNANTYQAVTAVSFRERIAEYLIDGRNIFRPYSRWPVHDVRGTPEPCGSH